MGKSHDLIRVLAPAVKSVATCINSIRAEGIENIPEYGMLLPKHHMQRDSVFLALTLLYQKDRSTYWVMKEFWPGIDWLCRNYGGALRVYRPKDMKERKHRRTNREAWNNSIERWKKTNRELETKIAELLQHGELVTIYPEGQCGYGKMNPVQMKYVNIAVKQNAPIVPIGIEYRGSECIFRIGKQLVSPYPENLQNYLADELAKLSGLPLL